MIKATAITVQQVIDFVNEHGQCTKANYKVQGRPAYIAGGRTHTEKTLLETYAGKLAERMNREAGFIE